MELTIRGGRLGRGNRDGKRDLTICLVTDSQEPSGMGEHMLSLAATLRSHSNILFACPPSAMGRLYLDRAAALGLDTLALDWGRPHASERFAEWLGSRRVDICHVHAGIGWEGLDVIQIARVSGVPVIIRTEHLPYLLTDEAERVRYTNALQGVDRIVCVSNEARASFVAGGVPDDLLTVIRNGIPAYPVRRGRDRARASLGLGAHARMVLTVARYAEQKDHRTLLDAVPAVLTCEPQAHFLWVGTGPLEEAMRWAIHQRGLDEHVILLGGRSDVPDLMAAADLFVLPSRFEGLPLAVLEAMVAGLPVVATRVCGTAEAVQDRVTGLLVEPGNSKALAAAISKLLAEPQRATQFGARGRVRAQQAFGIGRMARETLALYRELLARSRQSWRSNDEVHSHLIQPSETTP